MKPLTGDMGAVPIDDAPSGRRTDRERSYLVVGHVCVDVFPGGSAPRLGGTVFYATKQSTALGNHSTVVTACTPATRSRLVEALGSDVEFVTLDAIEDTTFEFGRDAARGPRRLVGRAPLLTSLPEGCFDVIHLGPVFGELSGELLESARRRGRFVGATPQGLLRGTTADGRLTLVADRWPDAPRFADAIALNDEEFAHLRAAGVLSGYDGIVLHTLGPDGACAYRGGVEVARHVPAPSDTVVVAEHTIGAGDTFAATAFTALAAGASVADAVETAVEAATAYVRRSPVLTEGPAPYCGGQC
ncbi:MAG: PfkB family carbohydrate kinase [Microthrixaceae bacterium]